MKTDEDSGEADGEARFQSPGEDDRGNGVAAVMKAVQTIEDQRDNNDSDKCTHLLFLQILKSDMA